jgi:hypothetical protein
MMNMGRGLQSSKKVKPVPPRIQSGFDRFKDPGYFSCIIDRNGGNARSKDTRYGINQKAAVALKALKSRRPVMLSIAEVGLGQYWPALDPVDREAYITRIASSRLWDFNRRMLDIVKDERTLQGSIVMLRSQIFFEGRPIIMNFKDAYQYWPKGYCDKSGKLLHESKQRLISYLKRRAKEIGIQIEEFDVEVGVNTNISGAFRVDLWGTIKTKKFE